MRSSTAKVAGTDEATKEAEMTRSMAARYIKTLVTGMVILVTAPSLAEVTYPVPALPIPSSSALPNQKVQPIPKYIGEPATAAPITGATPVPQHPFMGQNPWNCIHDDAYQSDTYPIPGPLGKKPVVRSTWLGQPEGLVGIVVGMTFDSANNLLIAGIIKDDVAHATAWVQLALIDAATLATLATFDLPKETGIPAGFRPAGAYFYLDHNNRIVIGTKERSVWVLSYAYDSGSGKWGFHHDNKEAPWELRSAIAADDSIQALQPDWSGRLWFTSKGGVVGTLDTGSGKVLGHMKLPGERIVNSHAAGAEGAVYIASTLAMYRFDADAEGKPKVTWRQAYDAGTHVKEGQTDIGTGTTPTLMGEKYVTITDNGQPRMHVLVYDRNNGDLVCAEPVFEPGSASNENSLIATDSSIIVENNLQGPHQGYNPRTHDKTRTRPCRCRERPLSHRVEQQLDKHPLGDQQDVVGERADIHLHEA
jgi:hypothetical protein